ncbi:MAG TPA: hypothetical protein DDW98_13035 [Gammaproteobacteria bacterium]|nr:hypothetical protein [Gammaproteobacteria bacterium]
MPAALQWTQDIPALELQLGLNTGGRQPPKRAALAPGVHALAPMQASPGFIVEQPVLSIFSSYSEMPASAECDPTSNPADP